MYLFLKIYETTTFRNVCIYNIQELESNQEKLQMEFSSIKTDLYRTLLDSEKFLHFSFFSFHFKKSSSPNLLTFL